MENALQSLFRRFMEAVRRLFAKQRGIISQLEGIRGLSTLTIRVTVDGETRAVTQTDQGVFVEQILNSQKLTWKAPEEEIERMQSEGRVIMATTLRALNGYDVDIVAEYKKKARGKKKRSTDRLVSKLSILIPNKHRDEILCDLKDDVYDYRLSEWSEIHIRLQVLYQIAMIFVFSARSWLSGLLMIGSLIEKLKPRFGK